MDGGMNIRMRKKDWLILGGKLATRIVKDTDKGISQDKDGKKFPPYTKEYAEKKSKGGGVKTNRQVSPPNLRLTGVMLNSLNANVPRLGTMNKLIFCNSDDSKLKNTFNIELSVVVDSFISTVPINLPSSLSSANRPCNVGSRL